MASRQGPANGRSDETDDDNEQPTDGRGARTTRRSMLGLVGATAGIAAFGSLAQPVAAAELSTYLDQSGDVTIPAGEYSWSGSGLDVGSGGSLAGEGSPGDVVWNLESGSFSGSVEGELSNVVVRGANPNSKAGIDLYPGATVDGLVWPEGGQQSEDRAFYTPEGGDSTLTVRNSAWAWMVNNGAYVDKPPVTMENCAAVNNNIAGIRVGHRDGTSSGQTTTIRNCLIAVTDDIKHDDTNSSNARGLRIRHPGHFVIENCFWLYRDASGAGNLIEIEDEASGSTVEIRNCTFYNESGGSLIADQSGGIDLTVENCVAAGSGDLSADGVEQVSDVSIPLPSALTGYAAADEIAGLDPSAAPWDSSASAPTATEEPSTSTEPADHTIVLHASPDNSRAVDVSFTVTGDASYADEAESGTDTIEADGEDTVVTSVGLNPDALDSYTYSGDLVDYSVPDGASVDVSLDGTTTSFAEIVGDGSGDGSTESTPTATPTEEPSTATPTEEPSTATPTEEPSTATPTEAPSTSTPTEEPSTSTPTEEPSTSTPTEEPSTEDPTSNGSDSESTDSAANGEGALQSASADSLPNRLTVDGDSQCGVTEYTFTVSGDVARDAAASETSSETTGWDENDEIDRDGKVIGVVGDGVDVYRFSGKVTAITVDGEAAIEIERDA